MFDLVVILKKQLALDGSGEAVQVQKIEAIDMKHLDTIMKWIDAQPELTFTAGTISFNWVEVMNSVRNELERGIFWKTEDEDGEKKDLGWNFLSVQDMDDSEEVRVLPACN
jgi:nucleosome binding factor SPN SPT16 subunit